MRIGEMAASGSSKLDFLPVFCHAGYLPLWHKYTKFIIPDHAEEINVLA